MVSLECAVFRRGLITSSLHILHPPETARGQVRPRTRPGGRLHIPAKCPSGFPGLDLTGHPLWSSTHLGERSAVNTACGSSVTRHPGRSLTLQASAMVPTVIRSGNGSPLRLRLGSMERVLPHSGEGPALDWGSAS